MASVHHRLAWLVSLLLLVTACGETKFASSNRSLVNKAGPNVGDAQGDPDNSGNGDPTATDDSVSTDSSTDSSASTSVETSTNTSDAAPVLNAIVVNLDPIRVNMGMTSQAYATAVYSDASYINVTDSVTWSVSSTSLASISNSAGTKGLINAKAAGEVKIRATMGDIASDDVALIIDSIPLKEIVVTPDRRDILVDAQTSYKAEAIYQDGTRENITAVAQWSVSPADVATLMPATLDGVPVVGKKATGDAGVYIAASFKDKSAKALLVVKQVVSDRLALEPVSAEITVGGSKAFKAILYDSSNKATDVTELAQWQSANTAKVSIAAGLAKGVAETGASPVSISASYGGKSAQGTVLVRAKAVKSFVVNPGSQTVLVNSVAQYRAVLVYEDNTEEDVTAASTWRSANLSQAVTDSQPGSFKALADTGDIGVTITASHPKASAPASALLVVNAPKTVDAMLWLNETQGDVVVENGAQVRVRWQSANATSCSLSPFSYNTLSGDRITSALAAGVINVKLSCTGPNYQSKEVSAKITVRQPAAALSIKANDTAGAISLPYDSNVVISWSYANATGCQITNIGAVAASGSRTEPHLLASRDYVLACKNLDGADVSSKVSVTIGNAPLPQVTLRANGTVDKLVVKQDTPVQLTWTTSNATNCSLVGPGVNKSFDPRSTLQLDIGAANDDRQFRMSCTGPGGQGTDSLVWVRTQRISLLANNSKDKIVILPSTNYTLTMSSANVNTCRLEYDNTSENVAVGNVSQNRQAGDASRNYAFRCQGDAGEISASVIVATLRVDVSLNGVTGDIVINKGQSVVISTTSEEAGNCYLDDTSSVSANDYNIKVPSEVFNWGPIQQAGERRLVVHCWNNTLHVEKGYKVTVNDLPPPPPPPFKVVNVVSGANNDRSNVWDGNILVCVNTNGLVTVSTQGSLSPNDEVKDLKFTVIESNGIEMRSQTKQLKYVGLVTQNLQLNGDWSSVGAVNPKRGAFGRFTAGALPEVAPSPRYPGCMTLLDGKQNQTGRAWVEINWGLSLK